MKTWLFRVVPIIVIFIWLAVAAVGGPTFGKLSQVTTNDQASYLPSDAESTKVQNILPRFVGHQAIPAIIVISTSNTLGAHDYVRLGGLTAQLEKATATGTPGTVIGPIPAADKHAVEYLVQLTNVDKVSESVGQLRSVVRHATPSGMNGYVTGLAGIASDLFGAFKGIDGVLLYVALAAVFLILVLVYRSIVLPFLVLLTAMFGLMAAGLVIYHGVNAHIFKLNGQSQGILSILVIGAATDYSLLLVARYREALAHNRMKWDAMKQAYRAALEPISASAATVIAGVLCLLFSKLTSNKDLGPVAAIGIAFAYVSAMTLLPALLILLGRSAFWPFRPKYEGSTKQHFKTGLEDRQGIWRMVPSFIGRHPRLTWVICLIVLGGVALYVPQFKADGISQTDAILGSSDAVTGERVLAQHFPAGSGSPVIIIASERHAAEDLAAILHTDHVGNAVPFTGQQAVPAPRAFQPVMINGREMLEATLSVAADSQQGKEVVSNLRLRLSSVDSSALVGGTSAVELDTNNAAVSDLHTIIPIVLGVILLILILLLRSLVAPILLIGSVILSFAATIGVSALVFNHGFHYAGSDAAIPLFGFIFLVALGVDYNIFLMTRVREESLRHGTRPGILRGLSVTGGVITSAGIVLAATFASLIVIPILFLVQIAFIVALGVLIDTLIVRSLLVPALCYDLGSRIWWPVRIKP